MRARDTNSLLLVPTCLRAHFVVVPAQVHTGCISGAGELRHGDEGVGVGDGDRMGIKGGVCVNVCVCVCVCVCMCVCVFTETAIN
jgi:hypothetical protein